MTRFGSQAHELEATLQRYGVTDNRTREALMAKLGILDDQALTDDITELQHIAFLDVRRFLTVDARGEPVFHAENVRPEDMKAFARIRLRIQKPSGAYQPPLHSFGFSIKNRMKALDRLAEILWQQRMDGRAANGFGLPWQLEEQTKGTA